jgi:hypothetical protein
MVVEEEDDKDDINDDDKSYELDPKTLFMGPVKFSKQTTFALLYTAKKWAALMEVIVMSTVRYNFSIKCALHETFSSENYRNIYNFVVVLLYLQFCNSFYIILFAR